MNQITIIGRLTKAPETATISNGNTKTTFTVAVDRRNTKGDADYLPVVTWGPLAKACGDNLVSGQRVAITGSVYTYSFQGNDGVVRRGWNINATGVEFLDRPQKTAASESPYGRSYKPAKKEEPQYNPEDLFSQAEGFPIQEDELPF